MSTDADILQRRDYDPIDHLNAIFSHPATLSSAPAVAESLATHQRALDAAIAQRIATQTTSDVESVKRIQSAKSELTDLFQKIETVQQRAQQTEQSITEMTADIKRLDNTKRNLTLSMTALKRLQMLTTAYEQLRGLGKSRQYKECAQLLQAVIQLMAHFKSYRSIDQIAVLGRKVADCQRDLLEQVCADFENAFAKGEVAQRRVMLAEACLVIDALGENARSRLITWYCNASLREYRQIFKGDEAGSLDNISRRYAWFNRLLKTYETEHAAIFPPHWRVNEQLANSFCASTRDDFKETLQQSTRRVDGQTLDVNLLLSCLQQTLDFEHSLERRFANEAQSRNSVDTTASIDDKSIVFEQAISEAFEPYLSLWVEAQDKHLATLVPKYRQEPIRNSDEEFSPQAVITSSTELFQFYRLTLAQCAKLSTGSRLLELSKTFAKYLDQYSQQILFYFLGDKFGSQGPSIEDTVTILNTADYCYATCNQLEEKIKARIDEQYRSNVDLQNQADTFMGIVGAAVRALVRKVEVECEPGWREMRNTGWSRLENVGDQSSYVGELVRAIRGKSSEILKLLHKQQYARAFCDNLVDSMTNSYILNIVQCRPVFEVGAEQMLLDFYVLKKAFTDLPTINSEQQTPQPAYAKRVAQTTAKVDPLLKTLQVRNSPPEALVQAYLIHIADRSENNFRKILDIKGLTRRQDQVQLVELFNAHRASHANDLVASSPLLTPLQVHPGGTQSAAGALGSSMVTPALAGAAKFDAASFGSALLSAARDGVDRFGTPTPGSASNSASAAATAQQSTSGSPARVSSPPHTNQQSSTQQQQGQSGMITSPNTAGAAGAEPSNTSNLNDNLRSIGKFFRRDMGTFGRFGSRSVDEAK